MHSVVIEENKRVKRGKFIFKLARTVNPDAYETNDESFTPLLKLAASDHRHFVLEQEKKRRRDSHDRKQKSDSNEPTSRGNEASNHLPPEINQMVNDYLKLNEDTLETFRSKLRKPSKRHFTGGAAAIVTLPSLDYVYDIYHLEKVPDEEFDTYKNGDVGFVKIVNKIINLVPDDGSDSADRLRSDDEDSNEENYYQNDYPEDEDDDRSILFGSEGEEIAADEAALHVKDIYDSEQMLWVPEGENPAENDIGERKEYEELFKFLGSSTNILNSLNSMNFVDLDEDEHDAYRADELVDGSGSEQKYTSHEFFPTDKQDPLAHHRDRIFGDLEKLISKK